MGKARPKLGWRGADLSDRGSVEYDDSRDVRRCCQMQAPTIAYRDANERRSPREGLDCARFCLPVPHVTPYNIGVLRWAQIDLMTWKESH